MTPIEKSKVKNAPLAVSEDRTEFLAWALSEPDGCIAAGWQPIHPYQGDRPPTHVLRASGAKLVVLARREINQTPDQIAAAASVGVSEVIALEHGDDVAAETVTRIAGVLKINGDVLVELFGFSPVTDPMLVEAATAFVVQLEPVDPLLPRESQALDDFRDVMHARRNRIQAS